MSADIPATLLQPGDRVQVHTATVRYHGRDLWVNYSTGTVTATWGPEAHTAVVQLDGRPEAPAISTRDLELL